MESKNLDRIFISLGYDVQRICARIDHRGTDNAHLDLDVSVADNALRHGCSERLLPKLCAGIGIERVDAIVGRRHKENVMCTTRQVDIGQVERLSKYKPVYRHTK